MRTSLVAFVVFCIIVISGCASNCRRVMNYGTPEQVQACIDKGVRLEPDEPYLFSALHMAAISNKDPRVIDVLVKAGAKLEWGAGYRGTPLSESAMNNPSLEITKALINAGANVNTVNDEGETPLHLAAWCGSNPEIVSCLIESGANVNVFDKKKCMPLHKAFRYNNNDDILKILLMQSVNFPNTDEFKDLKSISLQGNSELKQKILNHLIESKFKLNGCSTLHFAARLAENSDVFRGLVGSGVDVNVRDIDGGTPLFWAAKFNPRPEIIKALVSAGADVNATDGRSSPIMQAVIYNNLDVIMALQQAGADMHNKELYNKAKFFKRQPEILAYLKKCQ